MNKPDWIRGRVSWSEEFGKVRDVLQRLSLNSVCVSAACPNRGECWRERHVTFLVMGNICTRGCRFCNIREGLPGKPDPKEPENISKAVEELGSKYVVITSVTRDDIGDKGAGHFIKTVSAIKRKTPEVMVELLIPDFSANELFLKEMILSGADVIGHNTLADIKSAGVEIVYLGQYLSPSREHWPVKKYYNPSEFHFFRKKAREMGFKAVMSGPMVRSSYRAHDSYRTCLDNQHI
jgi:lipoic acid synthetase